MKDAVVVGVRQSVSRLPVPPVANAAAPGSEAVVAAMLAIAGTTSSVAAVAETLAVHAARISGTSGAWVDRVDRHDVVCIAATGFLRAARGIATRRVDGVTGATLAVSGDVACYGTTDLAELDQRFVEVTGLASCGVIALRAGRDPVAVLGLGEQYDGGVDARQLALVAPLVDIAALRISQLVEQEQDRSRLSILREVATSSHDLLVADDPGAALVHAIRRVSGARHAILLQPAADNALVATHTTSAAPGYRVELDDSESLAAHAYLTGQVRVVGDWTANPTVSPRVFDQAEELGLTQTRAAIYFPLESKDGVVGVLLTMFEESLTTADVDLLGVIQLLCSEAGAAISRSDLHRRVFAEARTDHLTGTANRRAWHERCAVELSRAERTGATVSVCMMDLDLFKRFNDAFGHSTGDQLLIEATRVWTEVLRPADLLARIGGEEFAVLLPDTTIAEAAVIAARLRGEVPRGQSVSIGATSVAPGEDIRHALDRADSLLYQAKTTGRDKVVCG